jgi:hypothetical protein
MKVGREVLPSIALAKGVIIIPEDWGNRLKDVDETVTHTAESTQLEAPHFKKHY